MGAIEAPRTLRSTMYSIPVSFSGLEALELRKTVIDHGVEIDKTAEYGVYGILKPTDLESVTLTGVTLADLGLANGASNQEVMRKAEQNGLVAPPQETALLLACMPQISFAGPGGIVMSKPIQSRARATDTILLGIVDGGHQRNLVGRIGAPRWRVADGTLLVFMQKEKKKGW